MAVERMQATIARTLPERMFDIRISAGSREKLSHLQQTLRENPAWNVILYFNHLAYGDPGVWSHIARTIDPDSSRIAAVLASKYHTMFRNNPPFAIAARLGDMLTGIHVIPTIQSYMVDDPKYGFTDLDAKKNIKQIIHTIERYRKRKPLMLLIAPEGHRSDDGSLGPAERGVVSFSSMLAPVLLVPAGVYYEGDFRRSGINTRSRKHPVIAHAEVGEPLFQERRQNRLSIDTMMHHLARTLPRELRGNWAE